MNCLGDWNSQFLICRSISKKANFEKLGLGIDNPCWIVFLSLRMNKCLYKVNGRHFWNPGVFSYAIIPRCRPNSRVFFHRPIYSLWRLHAPTSKGSWRWLQPWNMNWPVFVMRTFSDSLKTNFSSQLVLFLVSLFLERMASSSWDFNKSNMNSNKLIWSQLGILPTLDNLHGPLLIKGSLRQNSPLLLAQKPSQVFVPVEFSSQQRREDLHWFLCQCRKPSSWYNTKWYIVKSKNGPLFFSKPAQKPRYVIPKVWSNGIFPYQIAGAVIPLHHYTIRPVWIGL